MSSFALPHHMQSKQSFLLELLKLTMYFLIILFKTNIEQLLIFVPSIPVKITGFLHIVDNLPFVNGFDCNYLLNFVHNTIHNTVFDFLERMAILRSQELNRS